MRSAVSDSSDTAQGISSPQPSPAPTRRIALRSVETQQFIYRSIPWQRTGLPSASYPRSPQAQ